MISMKLKPNPSTASNGVPVSSLLLFDTPNGQTDIFVWFSFSASLTGQAVPATRPCGILRIEQPHDFSLSSHSGRDTSGRDKMGKEDISGICVLVT